MRTPPPANKKPNGASLSSSSVASSSSSFVGTQQALKGGHPNRALGVGGGGRLRPAGHHPPSSLTLPQHPRPAPPTNGGVGNSRRLNADDEGDDGASFLRTARADGGAAQSLSSSAFSSSQVVWIPVDLAISAASSSTAAAGSISKRLGPSRGHQPREGGGVMVNSNLLLAGSSSRSRTSRASEWGWCRARVVSSSTSTSQHSATSSSAWAAKPPHTSTTGAAAAVMAISSPTKRPAPLAAMSTVSSPPPPQSGSSAGTKVVHMTVTIDDLEFAPVELQNETVQFSYVVETTSSSGGNGNGINSTTTSSSSCCLVANVWWQQQQHQSLPRTASRGTLLRSNLRRAESKDEEVAADARLEVMGPPPPPQDLTELEQLHEPAVVYCLKRRYELDEIYTYTGKILLALNPFRSLPDLYTTERMQQYSSNLSTQGESESAEDGGTATSPRGGKRGGKPRGSSSQPHIYAIARDAWTSLQISKRNQSILVSGESGAGKTVTTKICLRYLAERSTQQKRRATATIQGAGGCGSVEQQVLQSNPILESFGNARTVRNDNSSRFGKLILLQFSPHGCLVSANIETYLLEKVRLISQASGERNFHVFYEILAGLPQAQRRDLQIGNRTAKDFRMTAQSSTFTRRDGVDDRDTFRDLMQAFETVGFVKQEQDHLFQITCGLLHTSNLTFSTDDNSPGTRAARQHQPHSEEVTSLDRTNPSLKHATQLLGVDADALNEALTKCRIEARGEVLYKNLTASQASKATEALIKVTYGAVFEYIVKRINESMVRGDEEASATAQIGILDIFGFESLETNSLEQLCINYCNEALQQQFNRFVFKLEQQEYQREGIEWSFITFPDNQDVLDLIEKKHEGILSILDEQCRLASCTDATFASTVYEKCCDHARLEASAYQKASQCFAIHHYAGWVEYDTANFVEKNKDELPKEAVLLLESSSHPILTQIGKDLSRNSGASSTASFANAMKGSTGKRQLHRAGSSLLRDTVGIQFSSQLKALRVRIEATEPHYVRCLKPNDELVPHSFQPSVIADQLTCAGVLEAIRVSRVGFPHRYNHEHFVERYSVVARSHFKARHLQGAEACRSLVDLLTPQLVRLLEEESTISSSPVKAYRGNETICLGMQMGKSKVFMRRKAFEGLEHLRNMRLQSAATMIQSCFRMHVARIDFDTAIYAVIVIQTFARRVGAYRMVRAHRAHCSAVRIQALWRASKARAKIRDERWSKIVDASILRIQRVWRGTEARRFRASALWIACWCQSLYRGARARQYCAFLFLDRKSRIIQRAYHKHKTTHVFRKLRRSVITLQNRQRLRRAKRELSRLRAEAKDLSKVAAERDLYRQELEQLRKELEEAKRVPAEAIKSERKAKSQEIKTLREEVDRLRLEVEKAHRLSETKSNQSEVQFLLSELLKREDYLTQLKREVESLRSKDDSFSVSLKSFYVEASPSSGKPRPTVVLPTQAESPYSRRGSPVRSDVSLFDEGEEGSHEPKGPLHVEASSTSVVHVRDLSEDNDVLQRLHNSIRNGDLNKLEQFLRTSAEMCLLINQGDEYGRTSLHVAAMSLRADVVRTLIAKGAVVNAQDEDGETPLHLAENPDVTEVLLKKGRANPNIPNVDGICAIHLAVQRRDIDSVRHLLRHGADVNCADNIRWFTPLHLIALPARHDADESPEDDLRTRIAQLLCGSMGTEAPDLDYQDSQSNAPLHYAAQLESKDICSLLEVFLDHGAKPNTTNERSQSPLHLLCHNTKLRHLGMFQGALRCMLHHGADPNIQSLAGCTALHLTLYHRDVDSAIQLIEAGAELHLRWQKPTKWPSFWQDMGSSEVLALDMVESQSELFRMISAITKPSAWAPARAWCMGCKSLLGSYARAIHCHFCRRLLCRACVTTCLPSHYFPKQFGVKEPSWVCGVCEKVLVARKEETSNATPPTATSYGDDFPTLTSNEDDGPSQLSFGLEGPVASSLPTSSYGFETATSSFGFEGLDAASSSFDELDGRSDLFAC